MLDGHSMSLLYFYGSSESLLVFCIYLTKYRQKHYDLINKFSAVTLISTSVNQCSFLEICCFQIKNFTRLI